MIALAEGEKPRHIQSLIETGGTNDQIDMINRIFISYRREDSRYPARRLYEALTRIFPPGDVFMDVDSIPPGDDFVKILEGWVQQCDVLLALIGPDWVNCTDPQTKRRRLDNPDDFVRIEIRGALDRGIQVVPVLLDAAPMPTADQLPDDIKALVRRQAEFVEYRTFDTDIEHLIRRLRSKPPDLPKDPAVNGGGPAAPRETPAPAPGPEGKPVPTPVPVASPASPAAAAPVRSKPVGLRSAVLGAILTAVAIGGAALLWSGGAESPSPPAVQQPPAEPSAPAETLPTHTATPTPAPTGTLVPAFPDEPVPPQATTPQAAPNTEARPPPPPAKAADTPTLLADIGTNSRWTIGTSKSNCNVPKSTYSLEVRRGAIVWRNGTGNMDTESISYTGQNEFRSVTQSSVHPEGRSEEVGQTWTYSRDGERIRVQPGGKSSFMLTRCS